MPVLGQRDLGVAANTLTIRLSQAGTQLVLDAVAGGSLALLATGKYLQTSALVLVDVDLAPQPITVKFVGKSKNADFATLTQH